jgi:P27 family predicted phage terminase small subunit
MGKRGPTGRPNHLKALEGEREDRLNRDEPIPGDGRIIPPVELDEDAILVWNRLAPDLITKKVLTSWDVDQFAAFCQYAALYQRAADSAAHAPFEVDGSHGGTVQNPVFRIMQMASSEMRSIGQRFGLSPGDRAGLKIDHSSGGKSGAEAYVV